MLLAIALLCAAAAADADDSVIDNGRLQLELAVSEARIPHIAAARWSDTGNLIFRETAGRGGTVAEWLPEELGPPRDTDVHWRHRYAFTKSFLVSEGFRLSNGLYGEWEIETRRGHAHLLCFFHLKNEGSESLSVPWFPAWTAHWEVPGEHASLRWWEALSFQEQEISLKPGVKVGLGSRLHSSDRRPTGQNPYWVLSTDKGQVFFGLEWCGGWKAEIECVEAETEGYSGFRFRCYLPPEETQLTLEPGSGATGPPLHIVPTRGVNVREARAAWMAERRNYADHFRYVPAPSYPLSYNHWYTTRFDVNGEFLQRQAAALDEYGFDAFIVDAGWYKAVGEWEPDPAKFAPGEFEAILKGVKDQGVKVGIWSCPQFIRADKDNLPPEVDQPGFYRDFIDGWLLDYAGMDFKQFLYDHVTMLRTRYHADWWKYDQDFFTEETRQGAMKNVNAFQSALRSVRQWNTDLYIENCQSGGRMINEFTVPLTQSQWIRDGGNTGPEHARSNFREALGALALLPPWTVNRWTNNPDRNDPEDDEFTRMYCRSAMAGTWGIVADLPKIHERQREIIRKEIANYRRLNELKTDCRYDLYLAARRPDAAGVTYFDGEGRRAGILLMRWAAKGAFDFTAGLDALQPEGRYVVEDVDTGTKTTISSEKLINSGLAVHFPEARDSALVFIEPEQQL